MLKTISILFAMFTAALPAMPQKKTMAIFVANDTSSTELKNAQYKLEKILGAHANNSGFGIISYDLALRNLNAYLGNPNAKYKTIGEKIKSALSEKRHLDNEIFESAPGLRIAEFIGADFILSASISSFGKKTINSNSYGVKTKNTTYTLRCNYSLNETSTGVGLSGLSAASQKSFRESENLEVERDSELISEMLEDCARQMAEHLKKSENKIASTPVKKTTVLIEVNAEKMKLPKIIEDENGGISIEESDAPLTLTVSEAEIDGISQPINGGKIELSKGIHYLKIFHRDFLPIEKTINVIGNSEQKFSFDATLKEEAKKRIKEDILWMQKLAEKHRQSKREEMSFEMDMRERKSSMEIKEKLSDADAYAIKSNADATKKLSDAEIIKAKGICEMLKKSGYNVKIDAKNMPNTAKIQSLISQ